MRNKEAYQIRKTESFFYGYIVVAAAFFIMMVSFGLHNSFGVFFKPLITEFGWTRAITSGSFSLAMIINGVLSIAMGGITDRFGPRMVVTLCGFFLGLGYLLMSQTSAAWQLYLFFGVMTGIGISGVWVPLLSSVVRWFIKRRSLMSGIVIAGVGIGGLVGPPVISWLISAYDWRLSYIMMGGVVLLSMVLAAQFLRRDPVQVGQVPYGEDENKGKQQELESGAKAFSLKEAIYTAQFWLFFLMFFCFGFGMSAVMVHIVPHAIDLGISDVVAADILAAFGGMGIIGNLVLGSLGDRIGSRQIYIIGFILMSLALFWLILAKEVWMFFLFAIVFGFAQGGVAASGAPLLARLFGLGSHGLLFGVTSLGFRIGAAIGPFVMGYIFDSTGSYQLAFIICAIFSAVGVVFTAILRPTKRLGGRI